jgi:flagellar motor protein MotB
MSGARRLRPEAGGDGFFASLNDLLIGLLFLFILLLMAFALRYQQASDEATKQIASLQERITERAGRRTALLQAIDGKLRAQKIVLDIDPEKGEIRLLGDQLFQLNSSELNPDALPKLKALALELENSLPCYSAERLVRADCPSESAPLFEAVYVEGHTDDLQFANFPDANWALSSERAIKAYRQMRLFAPKLKDMKNADGSATMFGVSAYADQRPLPINPKLTIDKTRAQNRRIAFRFLLAPPTANELSKRQAGGGEL